jgi:hypothetical protein
MKCLICQSDSRVYDSRPAKIVPNAIWRRRECLGCGNRWRTYERNEDEIDHDIAIARVMTSLSGLYELLLTLKEEYDIEWEDGSIKVVREAKDILQGSRE